MTSSTPTNPAPDGLSSEPLPTEASQMVAQLPDPQQTGADPSAPTADSKVSVAVADAAPATAIAPITAGGLIRQYREAHGLSLDALAQSLKVSVSKLEALENDRHAAHQDRAEAVFVRALANSVCRVMRVDASPVLALLPSAQSVDLEKTSDSLNETFDNQSGYRHPARWGVSTLAQPSYAVPILLLVLALVLALLPQDWLSQWTAAEPSAEVTVSGQRMAPEVLGSAAQPVAPAASVATPVVILPEVAAASSAVAPTAAATASQATAPQASSAAAAGVQSVMTLKAKETSWIEIRDPQGKILSQRNLTAGESWSPPYQGPVELRIGNAASTELTVNGVVKDLAPWAKNNVARLQIP